MSRKSHATQLETQLNSIWMCWSDGLATKGEGSDVQKIAQ